MTRMELSNSIMSGIHARGRPAKPGLTIYCVNDLILVKKNRVPPIQKRTLSKIGSWLAWRHT